MLESVSFDDAKEISSPKNESQLQSVSFEDAQAIANPRNRNPLEVGEDAIRQLAISANNGLSMLVSYQAPDSPIVKYLDESNQRLQSGISDPTKQVLANANAKTVDAEKRGEVESFLTTLPEYIGQPALVQKFILENILGFVGPLAAGKAVQAASVWMKLFQGAGSAAKAADLGHAATAATGAIATGGDAYSDAYKQNKVYAVTELGMNEEDANAYALEQGKAARGVGTVIGAVSAGTGIEGRAFQGAAKGGIGSKIVAPVAKDLGGELSEELIPPIATNLQTNQNWDKGLGQIAAQTIVGGSHASVGSAIVGANDYYKETVEEAPLGAPVTLPSKVMEASTVDEVISAAMEAVTPQSQPENNYATDEELIDQAAALQQPAIEPQQAVAPIQEPVIQPEPIAAAPMPEVSAPVVTQPLPAAPVAPEPVLTQVDPAVQEAALQAETASPSDAKKIALYRGVPAGRENAATVGGALFYSPDRKIAEQYAGATGSIKESSVEFNNLLEEPTWAAAKERLGLPKSATMEVLVNVARDAGYDGVSFSTTNGKEYIHIPPAPITENRSIPIIAKENITQTAPTTKISPAQAGLSENIAPVIAQAKKDIIPEANTGPSPEVLREESVARITSYLDKKAGKVFQLLHARGKSNKTGGVIVAHDMEHAAELYAKATGKTLDEAKIHLLGDAKATDNGETQGFFDPGTKTTYLLANNLDEKSAPAVLHHELAHAVATPELLEQADNLLRSKLPNKNLQAFIKKVQKRRKDAGEENNKEETASYIVEEALLHSKKDGFSKIDNTLFAHIADAFGKQTGEFVRSWVAKARAHLFTKGVVTKLTVDDLLALVQARAAKVAKEAPKGSNKQEEGSNKPVLERVPEELYKEEPKVSKAKEQVEKLKKKDGEAPKEKEQSILKSIKKPDLYSQLFKVLSNAPEKLFTTGAQVKLWLAANAGKNEIKKDEIYWSGINEWLDIQDKITKADVLSFLDQAGVQVEEVLLSDTKPSEIKELEAKKKIAFKKIFDDLDSAGRFISQGLVLDLISGDLEISHFFKKEKDQDRLSSLIEEYREVKKEADEKIKAFRPTRHGNASSLSLPGGENYGELILTSPTSERWNESDVTHFGSEGQGKAIGWIRFNTRKDEEGNKVLFLEEVQSQRSQAGRTRGFNAKPLKEGEFRDFVKKMRQDWIDKILATTEIKDDLVAKSIAEGSDEAVVARALGREEEYLAMKARDGGIPAAPFVADAGNKATNAYIGLLLKKAILYAIDTGHKSISWTTGNDQAERYGLVQGNSEVIGYLSYEKISEDLFKIYTYEEDGDVLHEYDEDNPISFDEIKEMFGERVALQIQAGESADLENYSDLPEEPVYSNALIFEGGLPTFPGEIGAGKELWTSKMYGDESGLTQDGKPALITQAANEIARKIGSLPVAKKELLSPVWQVVTNLGQVLSSFVKKEDADIVASNFRAPKSIWDTAEEDSLTKASVSVEPGMEVSFYPAIALTDAAVDKVKREGMPLFSKKASKAIRRVAPVSPQGQARGNRQEDNAGTAPETRANPGEIAGPNAPIDSGHPLGSFVNVFTRNQLVKMYQDSPIGTLLKEYKRLREQTAADENHLYSAADDFLGQLRALPKSQRDKFATLAHEATLSGIDPSAEEYTPSANSEELQKFVDSMKDVEKKSEAQAKLLVDIETRLAGKEAKYNELRAKFKALPEKSQELFVGLRDQYKKSSTLLFTEAKNRIGRMRDIDATSKVSAIEKLDKELTLLLGRVYFPLFRSGNHVVIATKPGEPKIVSYFETAKKADKEDKLLVAEGYTVTRDLRVVSGHAAKTGEALGKVIAQIDKAAASGSIEGQQLTALLDDINQTIIKSLPDQSFRKSFTHRKGTAGYSNDFIRAYADSMRRSASHIANLKHSDEIQRNIAAMRDKIVKQAPGSKKQALTEIVNRVEQIEKEITIPTGKLASLAGRIGFTQMLGSLSNFGLNLTQTPLNTFPHLGAEYGFTKAMLQLTSTMGKQIAVMKKPKSIREFSKFLDMRHDLSGTELAIFEQLHDAKKLDLTQAFDLIEAATNASENINDTWLNFMKFVALPQHTSEVINRQVTALATIRLEMARSGDSVKAYEAAKKAIDETHFDYSKDNRANIMTGNWLRVVTMFKQYAQNQMFLWGHTANLALSGSKEKDSDGNKLSTSNKNTSERNKARKQLAAMFAAQMVAAGLLGLPVFSESAIVASGVAGFKLKGEKGAYLGLGAGLLVVLASSFGDDDEEDFDTLVRNWLSETFGEDLGEVIGKGTLPRGIAARLDGSEMIVRKPKHNENPYDYVADWAKAIMGAFIGGTMINAGVGTIQILNEDIKGGVDKLLPLKQVKDMLQAYNWVKDDLKIKNTAGETVTEVTPMDVFWKALGINPSVAVRAREYDNAVRQLDAALTAKKQKTLKRLVEDLKDDPEQVAEEILAYNSEAPIGYKLTSSTIASEFRKETLKGTKLAGEPKDPKKKLTLEEKIKFYTPPPLTKED